MTDEVAALVLADNEAQTNALEIAAVEAPALVGVHARQMERLEQTGLLDRALERLPDAKALQERHAAGLGLTAPELAVLLAFTKLDLQRELRRVRRSRRSRTSARELHDYFPPPLRDRFGDAGRRARRCTARSPRPLSPTPSSTAPASASCRASPTRPGASSRARPGTHRRPATSSTIERHVVGDRRTRSAWCPRRRRTAMFLAARRLVERGARWLVRRHGGDLDLGPTVTRFREPVAAVVAPLARARGRSRRGPRSRPKPTQLRADGVPSELADPRRRVRRRDRRARHRRRRRVAATSTSTWSPVVLFSVADRLRLDWLRDRIAALPRADRWQTEARAALRDDVADLHRALTDAVLATTDRRRAEPSARVDAVGRAPTPTRWRATARCSPTSRPAACSTSRRWARPRRELRDALRAVCEA